MSNILKKIRIINICAFIVIAVVVIDLSANNIITDTVVFNILRLLTPKETEFHDMIIEAPSHYGRFSDEEGLLMRYYDHTCTDPEILITKNERYASEDIWLGKLKKYFQYIHVQSIAQVRLIIGGEVAYSLSTCNDWPSDKRCDMFVVIPSKQLSIHYTGLPGGVDEFRHILNKIRFISDVSTESG
ncbi:hypothetical protein [Desulfonema ishimotonii]|uniref:hypothetical protein n=1 Tax=Desulfonema ishimotonii TaxID=45657 RepID=UPI000F577307|nr:hypothetical protein [Desulfonema ishimotonii]